MSIQLADPERELALSYAPEERRNALRLLWAFDEKLGNIVASTSEADIGAMRLLWWREAVETLGERIPDEPLLAAIAAAKPGSREWGALAEGWHSLLEPALEADDLARFADQRGARLFALSAALLGADGWPHAASCGRGWALADFACRCSDQALAEAARAMARDALENCPGKSWPAALRPLGALIVLARRDVQTGRAPRRQGSPDRVMRMAWHRLSGR